MSEEREELEKILNKRSFIVSGWVEDFIQEILAWAARHKGEKSEWCVHWWHDGKKWQWNAEFPRAQPIEFYELIEFCHECGAPRPKE